MKKSTEPLQLLEQARAGDEAALEALLVALQPQLYRFSMKMCRHEQDAEDVLQNSMMTLARSFRDFRGASSLSTWLFTIARSLCIKQRRKSKFAPKKEESLEQLPVGEQNRLAADGPSPYEQAETNEAWQQVHRAIQRMEPAYREVLVLRDIEGLSAKEVAEVVEISVPAVKSRLHRARAHLRECLAEAPLKRAESCPNILLEFSKYLEGDLSVEICNEMKSHLVDCASCSADCDGLRGALDVCSAAPRDVPSDVQDRVKDALRDAVRVATA